MGQFFERDAAIAAGLSPAATGVAVED